MPPFSGPSCCWPAWPVPWSPRRRSQRRRRRRRRRSPHPSSSASKPSWATIDLEIDLAHAPLSAANFLRYVDGGRYDGGRFHRTVRPDTETRPDVPIEVVQAGVAPAREAEDFAPVPLERTRDTGLRHLAGTLSMARGAPDSATSDFFICLEDLPVLDFGGARNPDGQGFAAFGRVTSGLDVVRKIQAAPASGQSLTPPVAIVRAFRRP